MENIIELDNVTKRFGGITALNKASLKVTRGEVVGLIGDNGCLLYTSPSPRDQRGSRLAASA